MLESLCETILFLMRCQCGPRLREECRFIGSEAVRRQTAARYKLLHVFRCQPFKLVSWKQHFRDIKKWIKWTARI